MWIISKSLLAIVLLAVITPVQAETLKEEATRICHVYIDHPQDFKEIEMSNCNVIPEDGTESTEAKCFSHKDKETKTTRNFALLNSDGSCSSTYIAEVASDKRATELSMSNQNSHGYFGSPDDKALDYKGQLLFTNGTDLRLPQKDDQAILCGFSYETDGWRPPEPAQNPVCKKFAQNVFSALGESIDKKDENKWPKYPEAYPTAYYSVDLDSDGIKEDIIGYSFASGAGCGCDLNVLAVRENGKLDPTSPKGKSLDTALNELTHNCDGPARPTSIVNIDGHDYVLIDAARNYSPENKLFGSIPVRELYQFQSGKFNKICMQQASAKKVIQHEVYDKKDYGQLSYVPLE